MIKLENMWKSNFMIYYFWPKSECHLIQCLFTWCIAVLSPIDNTGTVKKWLFPSLTLLSLAHLE